MTTTPAPTDLDAAVDAAARAIQAYQARTAFPPEQYTWDAIPQEWRDRHLAAARVMVEAAMTPLLDELATERRQGAAMASITGEAIRQIGEERDAARAELAKTRAAHANEERLHGETIDDRDACHNAADKLAEAIAAAAGVDIGEHSNMNDPWANALDAMPKLVAELAEATRELAKTRADVEKLTTALDIVALREIRQAADLVIAQRDSDRRRESVQRARQEIYALKADCPTCGATPGNRCRGTDGDPRGGPVVVRIVSPHPERYEAAAAIPPAEPAAS